MRTSARILPESRAFRASGPGKRGREVRETGPAQRFEEVATHGGQEPGRRAGRLGEGRLQVAFPLEREDDVRQRDLPGGAAEDEPARAAATAPQEPAVHEAAEDLREKRPGDARLRREVLHAPASAGGPARVEERE